MNTPTLQHSNTPTRRVVGYVRGSTEEQVNTLEAQENQIRAYCAFKQLELVKVYVEQGVSGSLSFYERPIACEMLQLIGNSTTDDTDNTDKEASILSPSVKSVQSVVKSLSGVTGIVITKLDRGFRNALDCLFTVENLAARGIGLHLLDIQLEPDTPVGKLLLTMLAAIAEFENKRRSERQLAAFDLLKAKGALCGTVPYGWCVPDVARASGLQGNASGDACSTLIPDPEEQRVLRQIVHWIEVDRLAVTRIAKLLNEAGTPTKQGGKKWFPATVGSVYQHRRIATTDYTDTTDNNQPTKEAA